MNDRLSMPSALPADIAERISDCGLTYAEERAQEVDIERKAEELVCSEAFWETVLCGINALDRMLPAALARMMANTDNACSGDPIGRDALTTVASQIQRVARAMARDEVERNEL